MQTLEPQEPTHFRLYALSPGKQRTTDPALLFVPGHGGSGVPRKSHLLLLGVYWGDASSSASLKKKEANCCINRLHPFLILLFFSIKLLNITRFLVLYSHNSTLRFYVGCLYSWRIPSSSLPSRWNSYPLWTIPQISPSWCNVYTGTSSKIHTESENHPEMKRKLIFHPPHVCWFHFFLFRGVYRWVFKVVGSFWQGSALVELIVIPRHAKTLLKNTHCIWVSTWI